MKRRAAPSGIGEARRPWCFGTGLLRRQLLLLMAMRKAGVAGDDGVWFALEGLWASYVFFCCFRLPVLGRSWGRAWVCNVEEITV